MPGPPGPGPVQPYAEGVWAIGYFGDGIDLSAPGNWWIEPPDPSLPGVLVPITMAGGDVGLGIPTQVIPFCITPPGVITSIGYPIVFKGPICQNASGDNSGTQIIYATLGTDTVPDLITPYLGFAFNQTFEPGSFDPSGAQNTPPYTYDGAAVWHIFRNGVFLPPNTVLAIATYMSGWDDIFLNAGWEVTLFNGSPHPPSGSGKFTPQYIKRVGAQGNA